LVLLAALHLRPDQHEIHHYEHQADHQQRLEGAEAEAAGGRGGLCVSRGDQHEESSLGMPEKREIIAAWKTYRAALRCASSRAEVSASRSPAMASRSSCMSCR